MKIGIPTVEGREIYTTCDECGEAHCHLDCDNITQNGDCFHRCRVDCKHTKFKRTLLEITQDSEGLLQVIFAETCIECAYFRRFVMVNMVQISFPMLTKLEKILADADNNITYSDLIISLLNKELSGIEIDYSHFK